MTEGLRKTGGSADGVGAGDAQLCRAKKTSESSHRLSWDDATEKGRQQTGQLNSICSDL